MNSFQPTTAVNTLLSLDLGRDQSSLNKSIANDKSSSSFQRAMADQAERSEPRHNKQAKEPVKDTPDARPPLESKADSANTAQSSTNDDDTVSEKSEYESKQSKQTTSDSQQSESAENSTVDQDDTVQEVLALDSVDGELQGVTDESLAAKIDGVLVGDTAESEVSLVDAEESILPEELVKDVSAAAPIVQTTSTNVADTAEVIKEALPFQSRRQAGNGVTGLNPNAVKEESPLKFSELSLDSTTHKKTTADSPVVEIKPGVAKQMNNLLASLNIGQSTSRSDQVFKELMGKGDAGSAKVSSTSAASALASLTNNSRPAIATPLIPLTPLQTQVKAGVGQPQWQAAIAERIAFMSSQKITSAEIRLDPPELGPLTVKVNMTQDQATVSFTSQNALVREALDQTAFRLRDMFNSEGINLVDVNVSDQSFTGQSDSEQGSNSQGHAGAEVEEEIIAQVMIDSSASLIDHFV